jgi:hypothetical protein
MTGIITGAGMAHGGEAEGVCVCGRKLAARVEFVERTPEGHIRNFPVHRPRVIPSIRRREASARRVRVDDGALRSGHHVTLDQTHVGIQAYDNRGLRPTETATRYPHRVVESRAATFSILGVNYREEKSRLASK